MPPRPPALVLTLGALVLLMLVTGGARVYDDREPRRTSEPSTSGRPAPAPELTPVRPPDRASTGDRHGAGIFGSRRTLVAYYGTGQTGALGVLGETSPDQMHRR